MRTLRLSLVGTVILTLLGGLGGAVLGQGEPLDPMRASRFTGTWSEQVSGVGPDQFEWTSGPGYGESLGNESVGIFDASDPRIGGTWTQVNNLRAFPIDVAVDDHAVVWTSAVRIENEDGAWSGTVDGFHNGTLSREWYRLAGEGAYEGLTAILRWIEEGDAYEGVIIPRVPPDRPDPIAASADEEAGETATEEPVTASHESDTEAAAEATETSWPKIEWGVVYGNDDPSQQRLHVYMPEPREEPRPALIFFHGGGLTFGSPDWAAPFGEMAAGGDLGGPFVTFLGGYRLFDPDTGANPWPAQLDDVQRIVRWVRAHADEYNVDPDRVCSIGDSSGGQLTAMLAAVETRDDSDPELAGLSSRVDCAVPIAGVVDLTVPLSDPEQIAWDEGIYGGTLAEAPEAYVAASATKHVDADTAPMLILHGNRDRNVPIEQSRNLAGALGAAGIEFAYAELATGHGMYEILAYPPTWELVEAFLDYQLHPER